MAKELLFSVTSSDCDWKFQRGRGNGGQKKNKTDSACICTHRESGAQGYAEDSRSQLQNKQLAFKRMYETKEFKIWHKMEIAKRTGETAKIENNVDKMMEPRYIKVEGKNEQGLWEELNHETLES